ncbi:hypothetical protein [Streptomyces sp. SBT349]|uniref:hypothetical protein n=1 Tax=Streptomyces sp. SBT349 TaxID=1580539 RepID=UPI00066E528C|nr:hypothetical protein [Streptomyces sp. SBT349]
MLSQTEPIPQPRRRLAFEVYPALPPIRAAWAAAASTWTLGSATGWPPALVIALSVLPAAPLRIRRA